MNGEDVAVLITAVALWTSQYLSIDDLNILVAVFTQLADTYATLSVIRSIEDPNSTATTQQKTEEIIALETS